MNWIMYQFLHNAPDINIDNSMIDDKERGGGADTEELQKSENQHIRTSDRTRKPNSKYDRAQYVMNISIGKAIKSFGEQATAGPVMAELESIMEKDVLRPVRWEDLSAEEKERVMPSLLFLKDKYVDGKFEKIKARLAGNGYFQDRSSYGDLSSPTIAIMALLIVICIAQLEDETITNTNPRFIFIFSFTNLPFPRNIKLQQFLTR